MKALLLIGGLLGFGIGLVFSWAQESPWPSCLWHSCLAAYVTSYLMRWWGRAWRDNLEKALEERHAFGSATPVLATTNGTKP